MRLGRGPAPSVPDEAILAAFAARIGRIEAELPQRTSGSSAAVGAGRLHVVRGRTQRRSARSIDTSLSAGSVAPRTRRAGAERTIAAAAILLLVYALGRASGDLPLPAGPAAASHAAPAASAGIGTGRPPSSAASAPAASEAAPPPRSSIAPGPVTNPGFADVPPTPVDGVTARLAMSSVGWSCAVIVHVATEPLAAGLVAKLEATGRLGDGFVPGVAGPLWAGADPDRAARAFRGRTLVFSRVGDLWALRGSPDDGSIVQLTAQRSPGGTVLWRAADVLWPLPCARASDNVKALIVDRRAGDWPSGQVVDIEVLRLVPEAGLGRPS